MATTVRALAAKFTPTRHHYTCDRCGRLRVVAQEHIDVMRGDFAADEPNTYPTRCRSCLSGVNIIAESPLPAIAAGRVAERKRDALVLMRRAGTAVTAANMRFLAERYEGGYRRARAAGTVEYVHLVGMIAVARVFHSLAREAR